MSENKMTPEAAMLLLDAFMMGCPTVTGKASLMAIRAAVAELAQENERLKVRLDAKPSRIGEKEMAAERDALRRRVEELENLCSLLKTALCAANMERSIEMAEKMTNATKEPTT